jgi:hypothetical protein
LKFFEAAADWHLPSQQHAAISEAFDHNTLFAVILENF